MENKFNYNTILKQLCYLERDIKYNEVINYDIFSIVITKNNKVIFSSFCSIDDCNLRLNTNEEIRIELSTYIVSAIFRVGLLNSNEENKQTLEEYEKTLNKLVNQKYYEQKEIE